MRLFRPAPATHKHAYYKHFEALCGRKQIVGGSGLFGNMFRLPTLTTFISACAYRRVRAQCVRLFRPAAATHKHAYYKNFKALCGRKQSKPIAPRDRRSDEEFFERGCARMVFSAAATTFSCLLKLSLIHISEPTRPY